jgi:hypothetical protein
MPALNEAVWRNGGSSPQKVQCDFGSLPPARSSVEAATTPSRWDVVGNAAKARWIKYRTKKKVQPENVTENTDFWKNV